MSTVFLKVLNMSITAGWVILAVIVLRLLLRKAPKWSVCLLWGLAAVRLVVPFSFKSIFSLIPSGETIPANIEMMRQPVIDSGVGVINDAVNPLVGSFAPDPSVVTSINPLQAVIPLLGLIWLLGACAMLVYALASYRKLKKSVAASVLAEEGVMVCDEVPSPFILGLFQPLIYLPSSLEEETRGYVLDHERAHIKRRDHFWKPLGFLILAIHWFNPLCWIAYILLCRDIEAACDEKVIRGMDKEAVAAYSQALLDCSFPRKRIAACPLAFGEVGVKERVKNVLNYKKPAFWIILAAVVICIVAGVCFLTNPKKTPEEEAMVTEPTETDAAETEIHKVFTAVVTGVGSQLIVRPMEGMSELNSGDRFEIPTRDLTFEPAVGDLLEIDYNGMIQEGSPCRLEKIWSIERKQKAASEETFIWSGYFIDLQAKGEDYYHPYFSFDEEGYWLAGADLATSKAIQGMYSLSGDRVEANEQKVSSGPMPYEQEASVELRILEPWMLIVTKAGGDAAKYYQLEEGDILVHIDTTDTNAYGEVTGEALLRAKFPRYFDLPDKELVILASKIAGRYCFMIVPGPVSNAEAKMEAIILKPASLEEMRTILSTYDISEGAIRVIPTVLPWSSEIDDDMVLWNIEDHSKYLRKLLLQPSESEK